MAKCMRISVHHRGTERLDTRRRRINKCDRGPLPSLICPPQLTHPIRSGASRASSSRPRNQNQNPKNLPTKAENHIADAIALANGVALAVQGEGGETLILSLETPATPLGGMSGGQTPLDGRGGNGASGGVDGNVNENGNADKVSQVLLARAARATEAVLYTIAVSQLCYKQGRITVLPAVVLAANGFHTASASPPTPKFSLSSFSHARSTNPPPPHWPAVRQLTASMPALARFYAGGWRAVPEGERWWEDAFKSIALWKLSALLKAFSNGKKLDAFKNSINKIPRVSNVYSLQQFDAQYLFSIGRTQQDRPFTASNT
ncbi:hypothetical protein B0H13DRAFT_2271645 [Mycena leptocephala]|nr:hypothetical protein B0H13DRAFT_2271645 [Mycena leptocephala]